MRSAALASRMAMLERECELEVLRDVIETARAGRAAHLIVEGERGIGKSALLAAVRNMAAVRGLHVLSSHGAELERDIGLGVARRLLDPVVRLAGESAFTGMAALARPVFEPAADRDRSATEARLVEGLIALLADAVVATGTAHEVNPTCIVVDDAHWADAGSLNFLSRLVGRRGEIPALVVVSVPRGEPLAGAAMVGALTRSSATRVISPAALSTEAVASLVSAQVPDPGDAFTAAVTLLSRGNPLLVRETLAAARAEGLSGCDDDAPRLAFVASRRVARFVDGWLSRLPEGARALAIAVAILGECPLGRAAALADLPAAQAEGAADALAAAQLVPGGEPLRFRHPLVGAAVLGLVGPFERGRLHWHAAQLLLDAGAHEAAALQLLATRPHGEPWAADVLRRAASTALARGEPGQAARRLARALQEPPRAEERGDVLLDLARAEAAAGQVSAVERFQSALVHVRDRERRVQAWHGLACELYARHDPHGAAAAAARGRSELPPGDPLDDILLADLLTPGGLMLDLAGDAHRELDRLATAARAGRPPTHPALSAQLASYLGWRGIDVHSVPALARTAVAADPLVDESAPGLPIVLLASGLVFVDQLSQAAQILTGALERARRLGQPATVTAILTQRAYVHFLAGRLAAAWDDLRPVFEARRRGGESDTGSAALILAQIDLQRGDLAGAREAMRSVDAAARDHVVYRVGRGLVHLEAGEPAAALDCFLQAGDLLERRLKVTNPAVAPWRSYAAEAAHRLGQRDQARALAAADVARAREVGVPRALGRALRTAGLITGGPRGLEMLTEAVAAHETSDSRIELPRTLIELGTAQRRAGRVVQSRDALERALELADGFGALAVAAAARVELRAAGRRPRRSARTGPAALTASERRVAELAAKGLTTPAIARTLFVSPKTVETHLSRVFRKLDVHDRRAVGERLHVPTEAEA